MGLIQDIVQGLQLRHYAEDLKFKRTQQAQQAQAFDEEMKSRRQEREQKDIQFRHAILPQMGFKQATNTSPEADAKFRALPKGSNPFAGAPDEQRDLVNVGGTQYRAPSEADQGRIGIRDAQRKAQEKEAELDITDPWEEVQDYQGKGVKTRRSGETKTRAELSTEELNKAKVADTLAQAAQRKFPTHKVEAPIINHQKGTYDIYKTDSETGKRELIQSLPGAPKQVIKQSGDEPDPGISPAAQRAMENVQGLIDEANNPRAKDGGDKNPAIAKAQWNAALSAARQAAAAYPNDLVGGAGEGGFAFINVNSKRKRKGGAQTEQAEPEADDGKSSDVDPEGHEVVPEGAPGTASGPPRSPQQVFDDPVPITKSTGPGGPKMSNRDQGPAGGKTVPMSALPQILKHPDVQKRGIKTIGQLKADMQKNGYVIQ